MDRFSPPVAFMAISFSLMMLTLPVAVSPSTAITDAFQAKEQRIDITIRDSDFLFSHPVAPQLEAPTVIIVRNQDIIRHGFTSSILIASPPPGRRMPLRSSST